MHLCEGHIGRRKACVHAAKLACSPRYRRLPPTGPHTALKMAVRLAFVACTPGKHDTAMHAAATKGSAGAMLSTACASCPNRRALDLRCRLKAQRPNG